MLNVECRTEETTACGEPRRTEDDDEDDEDDSQRELRGRRQVWWLARSLRSPEETTEYEYEDEDG
jgi:hypothetical protein